jgi:hypothetical protein
MMGDSRVNMLATLLAIGSLVAAVVIYEAVTRMSVPSVAAVIRVHP